MEVFIINWRIAFGANKKRFPRSSAREQVQPQNASCYNTEYILVDTIYHILRYMDVSPNAKFRFIEMVFSQIHLKILWFPSYINICYSPIDHNHDC